MAEVHGQAMGRGEVRFFSHAGQRLVLRHYCRGGFVRHFVADRYLGLQAAASRSFREWHLLADLCHQGLPVPRPVAAAFYPAGIFYRADLVTCQIEDVQPLSTLLQEPLAEAVWIALGQTLRRFHTAQVFHADLNAHNILLDQQQQVHLLDFDRGSIRSGQTWKQENLNRLLRSLQKLTAGTPAAEAVATGWQQLLNSYRQTD